uniref:Protein kinase domain-containing protein n=1 Tax=Meloidogyne javanica TaxID=6303 RepID=A0A915N7D8_MELJA
MVVLNNDQQQKRRSKKIRWACIHPFPITEEQEERKHKLWAKTMIELTNKMNEVWIPPIQNNRIDRNGESTSCELQNNEEYNQNEVPSNNTFVPVQDEHGYLLCRNGDWIIDRFKIIKQIGDGVFSKVHLDASIRLIDFGSAVFEHQGHDETVTTRHYRAPEIILKNGWSFPCDIWSIGCILFELYSGCALFPKMDDIKHLATIERICGAVPKSMKRASSCGFYRNNNQLNCSQDVKEHVKEHTRKLFDYIKLKEMEHIQFFDLLENMLVIDPDLRITLKVASEHDFFEKLDNNLRLKAENGENINENGAT